MSKIALSPPASGTATFTLSAPATNTDRTLTLPDTTAPILAGSGITLSASAPANTLVTTDAGNVGIGTSSAGFGDLTVLRQATTSTNATLSLVSGTSGNGRLFFGDAQNSNAEFDGFIQYDQGNRLMQFGTAQAERMRIDSSGNVGIGTSSPAVKLHVAGTGTALQARVQNTGTAADNRADFRLLSSSSSIGGGLLMTNAAESFYAASALGLYNFDNQPIVFGTNNAERMRIDSSGNLLVGTTTTFGGQIGITSATNFVVGTAAQYWKTTNFSSTYYFNFNGNDRATINGSTGAYTAVSDRNKKKDFEPSSLGLAATLALKPTLFRMVTDDDSAPLQLGFIAQDVEPIIPQAYVEQDGPDGKFIGLQDRPIIAVLVKAIQEQQAIITALTARVEALEAK
jgi:hypothetical protein